MIQSASCFHLFGQRAEASVILQSRTYHSASESRVSIFLATTLFQLLSFCKVERTIALQKVAFPSFWALHAEASVVLQSRTYHCVSESCVSICLAVARFAATHGSGVISRRSHQRRQRLDSAYILSCWGRKHHPRTQTQICFQTFRASLKRAGKHNKLETLFATTCLL